MEAVAHEMGLTTVPSHANFVCIDLGRPARPVFEALLARGIIVRPGEPLGMPTHIRVSVGTPAEIEAFVEAFRAVLAPAAV
jgi:histidinol-phosphate aminotransferase